MHVFDVEKSIKSGYVKNTPN